MNTTLQIPPRQRLVTERLRRRWTQLEVADHLGTTPGNVSRWERGITSPGPYFRRKLCELFGCSAQELGLTWDESGDALSYNPQPSAIAASRRDASSRSRSFFSNQEDLLALLHTLIPSDTTALRSIPTNKGLGELNFSEQESEDQGQPTQTIAQGLGTRPNWVLIPDNAGIVVFVVVNSTVSSLPSSPQKRLYRGQITCREDCCDEYPATNGTDRQEQGA